MMTLTRPVPLLLMLDACCVINLPASARESVIMAALPYRCAGLLAQMARAGTTLRALVG